MGVMLAAALGFIAGYSTDFLFNKVQKIIGIFLPKDDDADDRGDSSSGPRSAPKKSLLAQDSISLKELAERHDKADAENDKKFYKDLIRHVAGAPGLASSGSTTSNKASPRKRSEGDDKSRRNDQ